MKKTVICNLTMRLDIKPIEFSGEDFPQSSPLPAIYPINAYMSSHLNLQDDVKIILLVKEDPDMHYFECQKAFFNEFERFCSGKCYSYSKSTILIPFDEALTTHNHLLSSIVNEIENGSELLCDITFGSKDLPIILFSALSFAVRHLKCKADYIFYRQVFFRDNQPTDPKVFNLAPLLHLTSLIDTVTCDDPEKARAMLNILLTM